MASVDVLILQTLYRDSAIQDSETFAKEHQLDHNAVVGIIKSLQSSGHIVTEDKSHSRYVLTADGQEAFESGSPEAQVYAAIPDQGISMADLQANFVKKLQNEKEGKAFVNVGFAHCKRLKWLDIDKSKGAPLVVRKVDSIEDTTRNTLQQIADNQVWHKEVKTQDAEALKKRGLVGSKSWTTYSLQKGPNFALEKKKQATDLTHEMLKTGEWRNRDFKAYNFDALGQPTDGGYLHPLLKVRAQIRKAFVSMGFEEMPTNNYVESSFWNFDALFQPQQHPARDAHDTFFITNPAATPLSKQPQDYVQRVRDTHEKGGDTGSIGYGSHWKVSEAEKNLLRTHTTAVSSRMLYKLAQEGFKPAKYFSIDRVFRNEAIDKTHLAEFHQIEGVVCDRGLTLGDLIGILRTFFSRLGLKDLKFKPAFNPYTEPSMEIFAWSEDLGKSIEVGNSGMFRPEMLRPMGLPEDVNVIAWGLGLERPTMILYKIPNIRDLFGHKVSLAAVKKNPICRLNL